MDPVEVAISVDCGRSLRVFRYGGGIFSDLVVAFNMSRSGMRGFLSKNDIKTVQHAKLKEAVGLGGKVHFLDRDGIKSIL